MWSCALKITSAWWAYRICQNASELLLARPPELNSGMCQKARMQALGWVFRSFVSQTPCGEVAPHPPALPQLEFSEIRCQLPMSKLSYPCPGCPAAAPKYLK